MALGPAEASTSTSMRSTFSAAEDLPAVYRVILDGIAVLESTGRRAEAARIRVAATRVYSAAWDPSSLKRLERLSTQCRLEIHGLEGMPLGRETIVHRARRLRWPAPGLG